MADDSKAQDLFATEFPLQTNDCIEEQIGKTQNKSVCLAEEESARDRGETTD